MNPPQADAAQSIQVGVITLRGALLTLDGQTILDVVRFQYNPESIKRTFTMATREATASAGDRGYVDAPGQSISFKAYFDATDKLGVGDTFVANNGLAPELAVLEKLIYPARADIKTRDGNRDKSQLDVKPVKAPHTMLVWGQQRALPVEITALSIDEEAFDPALNPIRATADITVAVQTYATRATTDDDYNRFAVYHSWLENAAKRFTDQSDKDATETARLQAAASRKPE
jgi:hypothetical protein